MTTGTLDRSARIGLLIACIATAAAGCTVSDPLVEEIGTTRILFTHTGLAAQSLSDPETPLQVAEWNLLEATLDLDGTEIDLLAGDTCRIVDTAFASPGTQGRCATGRVIDSNPDEPRPISLTVRFTMEVRRAEPVDLEIDFDGDGVPNEQDICPMVPNPDQLDDNLDGIGDACGAFDIFTGLIELDSDGDGVADVRDNCQWPPNPAQHDTEDETGIGGPGLPDGIGDACEYRQQEAVVESSNEVEIVGTFGPIDLTQPQDQRTYVTVDFKNLSATAMNCNWASGICALDVGQAVFCVSTAPVGCS